jgi:hypothetical protein
MPKTYTVEDSKTGKTVTFDWDGTAEPTDADFEEVFKQAATWKPEAPGPAAQAWGMYESAMALPKRAANAATQATLGMGFGDVTKAFRTENLLDPYLEKLGLGSRPLAASQERGREALKKVAPRLAGAEQGLQNIRTGMESDPMTAVPFLPGGAATAAIMAPGVLKGAGDAVAQATVEVMQSGFSPEAVEKLTEAAGSSLFAGLVVSGLKSGKAPEAAIQDAHVKTFQQRYEAPFNEELGGAPRTVEPAAQAKPAKTAYPSVERLKKLTASLEETTPVTGRKAGSAPATPGAEAAVYRGLMEATGPTPRNPGQVEAQAAPAPATPTPSPDFQLKFSDRTKTFSLNGPNGEKVAGKILPDRIEMTSIGKGRAADSRTAVEALRKLGQDEGKPVLFTSTNLSTSGGKFRARMMERGELVQTAEGLHLKGTPASALQHQLEGSLALAKEGKLFPLSKGRPAKTKGFPEQPVAAPEPLIKGSEAGAFIPPTAKEIGSAVVTGSNVLRASAVGQLATGIRNTLAGVVKMGEGMVLAPAAAQLAEGHATWLASKGRVREAATLRQSAQHFKEAAKSFPKAGWDGMLDTLHDAVGFVKTKGGAIPARGKLPEQLQLLRETGNVPLAERLEAFSDPTIGSSGKLRKVAMFFSILGDRFTNRTFLDAWSEGLRKSTGAKDLGELRAKIAADPALREFAGETLAEGTGEAFKASWQQMSPEGTLARKIVSTAETNPIGNVVSLVTEPFARSFVSNMLPNIVEKTPLAFMSKRVRNSFEHMNLRGERLSAKDALKAAIASGDVMAEGRARQRIKEAQTRTRELEKDVIYNPHMVAARMGLGAALTTGFALLRVLRGDDGTEADEIPLPGGRVLNAASTLADNTPFALAGDVIGHTLLGTNKYKSKSGVIKMSYIGQALQGSRHSMPSPGKDLAFELAKSFLGAGDKDEVSEDYLKRLFKGTLESVGRMAGTGAWAGDLARRGAELGSAEERKTRRTDVGPVASAAKRGFQSQVPGWRQGLPESPRWSKPDVGKKEGQVIGLLGATDTPSKLEAIMRREGINPSDVLPRRSDDPNFDMIFLEKFKEGVEGKTLPLIEKNLPRVSAEGRETYVVSIMRRARETARAQAAVEYRKRFGKLAPHLEKERAKKKAEVERRRAAVPH